MKVGVVVGGGSGIGRGIVMALAHDGFAVVVADIDETRALAVAGEAAAVGAQASAWRCDVTDPVALEALADFTWDRHGRADWLFNNAGVFANGPALDVRPEDPGWLFEVNVHGTWRGCQAFGRRFVRHGIRGHICNTASVSAIGMSNVQSTIYSGTKHAILGFSDVLRHEYRDRFGVSVLCPGAVATDFWNSERHRPARYGEPAPVNDFARRAMGYGLDPLDVGRLAVDGVARGEFFIFTSPLEHEVAERRWHEIDDAFRRQWPDGPGPQHRSGEEIQALVLRDLTRGSG